MAEFVNLNDPGEALVEILKDRMDGPSDIMAALPIESATASSEAIRLTLLWVTPQPTHRNDIWESDLQGRLVPPPLSLSGFYVVTAYGTTSEGESAQAYNRLGQVLQVFDREPRIELPQSGVTSLGKGSIGVVPVPTAADLMEKIYTPLQIRHRPWVLLEVGPIQLRSLNEIAPEQPRVHPGGARLGEFDVSRRPEIQQITPSIAGQGSRIRIDADYGGPIDGVRIGETMIAATALTVPEPNGPVLLTVPPAITPGFYDVALHAAGSISAAVKLEVRDATLPSLDAPAVLTHPISTNLVLTGRALNTAVEVTMWPAEGIAAPSDIITLSAGSPPPGQITLPASALGAAKIRPITYRIAARIPQHQFTPFVLMEFKA